MPEAGWVDKILLAARFSNCWLVPLLVAVTALSAQAGEIRGRVVNGTGGPRPVASKEVLLRQFEAETPAGGALSTTTDSGGMFIFRGLPTSPNRSYVASVTHQSVEYNSERILFDKGETLKEISITVYDTTSARTDISARMYHVFVEPSDGRLVVAELLVLANETDRTIVPSREEGGRRRAVLTFALPRGSTGLQLLRGLMDCCVTYQDGTLSDLMEFRPGPKEVAFSYQLSHRSSSYEFRRRLDHYTRALSVFVGGQGITVESPQLSDTGVVSGSQRNYKHLSAQNLGRGTEVLIELSGLKGGRSLKGKIAVGVVGLLVLFVIVYPVLFRRRLHL